MLMNRSPSWRQGSGPQPFNQAQDLSEQRSWDGDLCELKSDLVATSHHLGANLDALVARSVERPVLYLLLWHRCLLLASSCRAAHNSLTAGVPATPEVRA